MVNFCVRVAELQEQAGRFYYFEHPLGASSWNLTQLRQLLEKPTWYSVVVHMCRFGLKTRNGGFAKKPTRILTNLASIAEIVKQCLGGHTHEHLVGGRAEAAAFYTDQFVDAILKGTSLYRAWENDSRVYGLEDKEGDGFVEGGDMCEEEPDCFQIPFTYTDGAWFADSNSGKELDPEEVAAARKEELEGFSTRQAYEVRSRSEAQERGLRPIGVRWVDVEKKTEE